LEVEVAGQDGGDPLEGFRIDESTKGWLLTLYKAFAVPSVVAAVCIFSDLLLPGGGMDGGRVVGKGIYFTEGVHRYVEIRGKHFHYREELSRRVFGLLREGDRVVLYLTPLFKEVKRLEVFRGQTRLGAFRVKEPFYMVVFGLFALSTLLPFWLGKELFSRKFFVLVVASPLLAFASVVLLIKLCLVLLGVMPRL